MPYSIAANANDSVVLTFLLLKIDFTGGTVYWTNADISIVTGTPGRSDCAPAATWTPKPIRISQITSQQGSVPGAMLDIGDADNVLTAILFGANNPVGTAVHVWEAWFDPTTTTAIPADTTQKLEQRIDSFRVVHRGNVVTASIQLGPPVDFRSKVFPRRVLAQKCMLDFKGSACQYASSDTSCLRTLTACTAKSNQANYGGFPMLPAVTV